MHFLNGLWQEKTYRTQAPSYSLQIDQELENITTITAILSFAATRWPHLNPFQFSRGNNSKFPFNVRAMRTGRSQCQWH